MSTVAEILDLTKSVVLIDWPARDVPDTLARAGYTVISKDGPGVDGYNAYVLSGRDVVVKKTGTEPEHADLIYMHRPFDELPEIIDVARRLGAHAIWSQAGPDAPGADRARQMVESAGLTYVDVPRITDAVLQHHRR